MIEPYYSDDAVTIYHGDCRDVLPTLSERASESVRCDLLLTDPPFFMPATHYSSRTNWQRSWADTSVLGSWWGMTLDLITPLLRPTASALTFCDHESYPVFYPEFYRRFDAMSGLVWDKGTIGMGSPWRHSHEFIIAARWSSSSWEGGGGQSDILRFPSVPSTKRVHPVDKPTDLLGKLITATTKPGGRVLDPFIGGGSTLLAARSHGRHAIGIEAEERYCEIAATRLGQGALDFDGAA